MLLQEHWLYHFEEDLITKLLGTETDWTASFSDQDNHILPVQPPRGQAGTAIIWHKNHAIAPLISRIKTGPNLSAIRISTPLPLLMVSVYMPCRGIKKNDSLYVEILDEIRELVEEHQNHQIICGGDWNATTRTVRDARDRTFQTFLNDNCLTTLPMLDTPTFFHPGNSSSSQIDYFITTAIMPCATRVYTLDDIATSTSDHILIATFITMSILH